MHSNIFDEMRSLNEEETRLYKNMKKHLGTVIGRQAMVTNKEREKAAEKLRDAANQVVNLGENYNCNIWMKINEAVGIDWDCDVSEITLRRIADLIDPSKIDFEDDLENICEWAYYNMEGCDEPEWSLFSGLYDVIKSYMEIRKWGADINQN